MNRTREAQEARQERQSQLLFALGTLAAAVIVTALMLFYVSLNGPSSWAIYGPMLGSLLLVLGVNWWRYR